jgi:LysR family glycine cleavage system transcriptional activator
MNPRNFPPLNALRAFESAARHRTFSRAAEELCVTQGAVSRQIAKLESHVGMSLFRRGSRRLELTFEGARFYGFVHEAFERILDAMEIFSQQSEQSVLKIKVPPTFGIRWFVPRLVQFHGLHPEMDVQITTSHQPVDFSQEHIDVAVHWGAGDWEGLAADYLIGEELTPVCSPALLQGKALRKPSDLAQHILLHSMNRTNDWRIWLEAAAAPEVDWTRALKFENSGLTYQAAIDRLGVVVAQRAFIEDDLATGRLVAPFKLVVPGERAYYLVYPPNRLKQAKVAQFRDWLLDMATAQKKDGPSRGAKALASALS